jgi:ACS family hexuronate transporter-like MFS transporter
MPDDTKSASRFRWVICALLFFACVVNYMDRQVLGLLWGEPEFKKIVGWNDRDYGIITMFFQTAYAFGQVVFGPLMEWLGTKMTYAGAMIFWSLAAMAHPFARGVGGWGAARFALGAGESGNYPAAIKTVTEWFPPRERSVATGIFNAGSNVGAIFAPLIVPWLFYNVGWQGSFVTLGVAGFVWLVFWLWLYHAPEKSPRVSPAELALINTGVATTAEEKIPWTKLLGYREAWAYYGTCVLVGPVWWFYGFWLPGFFSDQFNLKMSKFGPLVALVGVGAALGSIFGGALSAWFLRRGWTVNRARKTASFICATCTLPVIATPHLQNKWLAALCFAVASAAHQGWSATMYSVVADIFPKRAVASVVGFGGMLAGVVSTAFFWFASNEIWRRKAELGANYHADYHTYGTIMLICGSAYLVAWLIFHVGVPRIKPADVA